MDRNKVSAREQKILKSLDKIWISISKISLVFFYLLTLLFLAKAIYYKICEYRGMDVGNHFRTYSAGFLIFAGTCAIIQLLQRGLDKAYQKNFNFNPQTMALPAKGTVTLETALHRMSVKTGAVVWDTIFAIPLISLLGMTLFLGGNVPLILFICLALAILLAAGHVFFSRRWKKRSFTARMLRCTEKYIPTGDPCIFASRVEKSLMGDILYYAKEIILTEDYIIGKIETDLEFYPVAIPRTAVTDITFFTRKPVTNYYRKFETGILEICLSSGKSVELLIGQGPRMFRTLNVLDYYGICWGKADTIYE